MTERSGGGANAQTSMTGETAPPNTTAPTATPLSFSSQAVPLISTVRVPIPLEIRGILPSELSPSSAGSREVPVAANGASAATATTGVSSSPTGNRSDNGSASTSFGSDPGMELIMEVTPDGISFDSLDASGVRTNQAEECK